ncbi:hypothetical protein EW026_g6065 [Hermanssonia centrifuga]|uniref:Signal recognition particle subunit SRP72 n=1 Tax=Hermanssonia centrifuga TaxID=98765 RepID=A0A4S4KC85_9APHY|nr:hypothetical protein EW026_g6065 [Hermanssonia centrifuga]
MPPSKPIPAKASAAGKHIARKSKKTTPKQPLPISEKLKRLFTSLCAQIDGGHFSNAIKTCDKILRIQPGDKDAAQTKLFLLLQTEQYNAALTLIDEDDAFASEKAYSLYRTNRESEARETLDAIKSSQGGGDRGVLHLEAQLDYREGAYQSAFDFYNQLLDTAEPHSDEHADILTNLEAAQKHLDFIDTGYLRALNDLPASVSSVLESTPPPQPSTSLAATLTTATPSQEVGAITKEKQIRTKRIPKGVVIGVTPPPDPERWLKKSERSTFGQGGKRRKGGGGGGGATQGAVESTATGGAPGHSSKAGGKGKKKK